MYKQLTNEAENIQFLLDRSGEQVGEAVVPKEVEEWVAKEPFLQQETGYVGKFNDVNGFFYIEEYPYKEQSFPMLSKSVDESKYTNEKVLEALKIQATKVAGAVSEDMTVFLGNKTGFCECHEMILFFPIGTPTEIFNQVLDSIKGEREVFLSY